MQTLLSKTIGRPQALRQPHLLMENFHGGVSDENQFYEEKNFDHGGDACGHCFICSAERKKTPSRASPASGSCS
jgi:hypothetical protein